MLTYTRSLTYADVYALAIVAEIREQAMCCMLTYADVCCC